jgi:nuclear pore complex protein Nup107
MTEQCFQTSVEDLKRWEDEEQTWDLLGRMLQVEYPIPFSESENSELGQGFPRPQKDPTVHLYSSEKELWTRFLAEDDLAWERHTVVEWLRKCADGSGEEGEIDAAIKDLEVDADRGAGLWAHSWLYTKEAIKRQKRLRSWPQPLDPNAPGLDTSILVADQSKGLVTQLDPDAITRQARALEEKDQYFERAMWLACWEMIRRGKSWDFVREWCRDRVEGWRAVIMLGDPRLAGQADDGSGGNTSLTAHWQSRALWRKTCAIAAKNGGVDKYENAVYGALSGYLPSTKTVCKSWNDYLFAHYNSYLLRQFDRYVRSNFSERLPTAFVEKYGCYKASVGAGHRAQSGNQIVQRMKTLARTGKEARQPLKMLQGSLIAKTFDDFICTQGIQLSRSANQTEKSKILPKVVSNLPAGGIVANITVDDHDLLRIITHILFIFQDLGLRGRDDGQRTAMENFVVAYIDYLSKAGKQQLLPLYASRLSTKRSMSCLGRQLPTIRNHAERQTMMQLMKQYGIDVLGVLGMQLSLIIADNPAEGASNTAFPKLNLLEPTQDDKGLVHQIRAGFLGVSLTVDEQDLINGFEWYLLLDGHWRQTMAIGAILYKHFLREYRPPCDFVLRD